jgi:hypothetical protein
MPVSRFHGTPTWMPGPASTSEGQVVYSLGEDDDGVPSRTEPIASLEPFWLSANGVGWQNLAYETFTWRSAVKIRGGYVAISQTGSGGPAILWSRDDRSWSVVPVSIPSRDMAELAGGPSGAVLELVPSGFPYRPAPLQFLYSRDGRSWNRAPVIGAPPVITDAVGTMPTLIAADGGFLAFDRTNTGIWWSKSGSAWTRVDVKGAPSASLEPRTVSVDGDSLLLVEQGRRVVGHSRTFGPRYQFGPSTFWRISLASARAVTASR